jgi:hypothetical protein
MPQLRSATQDLETLWADPLLTPCRCTELVSLHFDVSEAVEFAGDDRWGPMESGLAD